MSFSNYNWKNLPCIVLLFLLVISLTPRKSIAQNNTNKVALLWPKGTPLAEGSQKIDKPTLTIFLPKTERANGTGVVIFPGGGYAHLAMNKEGYKVAKWLNSLGVAAFVVKYRLGMRYHYPAQYRDGRRAIQMVRKKAHKWHVNSNRIGVIGFSAGGHLASTVGTHYNSVDTLSADPYKKYSSRPDFMILGYPVITMKKTFTHQGSRKNLLGEHPDSSLVQKLSNETQVTSQTPLTFLVQGSDDHVVSVLNSVKFYTALRNAGVPAEIHIFEHASHGFGLAQKYDLASSWPSLCKKWLEHHHLLSKE